MALTDESAYFEQKISLEDNARKRHILSTGRLSVLSVRNFFEMLLHQHNYFQHFLSTATETDDRPTWKPFVFVVAALRARKIQNINAKLEISRYTAKQ